MRQFSTPALLEPRVARPAPLEALGRACDTAPAMIPRSHHAHRSYLQYVQRLRKYTLRLGLGVGVGVLLFTNSVWLTEAPALHDLIARVGVVLILICIAGRTWCTLYIGGLKKTQLVTQGPYSLVRNPLYVFTIIGVAGVGAQAGSFTMPVVLAAMVAIVFYAVALQEQAFLAETFGSEYRAYAERVPLFFPRFSTWQEADQLVVRPELVRRTFMDASLFLLAVPFNDLIKWLQDHDWLRVLAHLP
ncbi:MAG: isoprenylcysteine carboxylmethyltransferase family protein [Hyphomicrobiaceae bacterium]